MIRINGKKVKVFHAYDVLVTRVKRVSRNETSSYKLLQKLVASCLNRNIDNLLKPYTKRTSKQDEQRNKRKPRGVCVKAKALLFPFVYTHAHAQLLSGYCIAVNTMASQSIVTSLPTLLLLNFHLAAFIPLYLYQRF